LNFQINLKNFRTTQYAQASAHKKPCGKRFFRKSLFRGAHMNRDLNQLRTLARETAARYNKNEAELMRIIKEIHQSKAFVTWGFTSLFDYCVQELKLSEASTSNFSAVAKKSNEVPALAFAVENGELSISKARKIVPVVTKENHDKWLSLAKTSTSREIEKAVAIAQPKLAVKEVMKFVAENVISVTTAFTEEEVELLKRVMDLESQKTRKASSRKDALVSALKVYIEHNDPVVKAERAEMRAQKKLAASSAEHEVSAVPSTHSLLKSVPGQKLSRQNHIGSKRSTYPAALVHAVHLRDQLQCTIKDQNGKRCGATRWLDIHHVIPRSHGGRDTLENLTTVCSAHHRFIHSK
jgi:5-methylcytosine-specific restriction endonuclease McrA